MFIFYQRKLGGENLRVTDGFINEKGGVRFAIHSMKGGVRFTIHSMEGGVRCAMHLMKGGVILYIR